MISTKSLAFLFLAVSLGVLLVFASLYTGWLFGWIGAAVLLGWALGIRRRWADRAERGLEPGPPERVLWLRLCGAGLVVGHTVAALVLVGDDLQVGRGNVLAYDLWTMIVAYMVASMLFRSDSSVHDERHAAIAAHGAIVGYRVLTTLLVVLLLYLVIVPFEARAFLTHFVLANILIVLMLTSYLAMILIELAGYARDTQVAASYEGPNE